MDIIRTQWFSKGGKADLDARSLMISEKMVMDKILILTTCAVYSTYCYIYLLINSYIYFLD